MGGAVSERFEAVLLVVLAAVCLGSGSPAAHAAITTTGDVDPANPAGQTGTIYVAKKR